MRLRRRTTQQARVVLQAASLLLGYPDDRLLADLPVIEAAVGELPAGPARDRLTAFLAHLRATPLRELQEHYVSVLDRRRRCSLYLTWWTDGETRRRGLSLARLKELYRSHGRELDPGELPDFLPVVLEFGATVDLERGLELLSGHRAGLELLRLALSDLGSPYASPVEAVCSLLPGPSPADEAQARALARTGPPLEGVGLAGYGSTGAAALGETADLGPTSLLPSGARR
ncbi:MAG: nitrate reductase molybdenum cofactor assembly chaperone [Actinomycetales bacterium]|nr:nitrate reductase molybdenum cofactor assembly chaperone [Actinomycetales bacterium]